MLRRERPGLGRAAAEVEGRMRLLQRLRRDPGALQGMEAPGESTGPRAVQSAFMMATSSAISA